MKKSMFILIIYFLLSAIVTAQTNNSIRYQRGYYKPSTGTYVHPHYKTARNYTNHDNFSTKDNTNSYTEKPGYRAKDYSNDAYNYGGERTIHTGSRGGQYYYNDKGNKVYIPKRK